jgi:dihydrofolate reductase
MSKVIWHVTMSVDGFIAGPNGAMDCMFACVGPNPAANAVVQSIGAVLAGRRSYELGRRAARDNKNRGTLGGAWNGPVFVLTHRPPADELDATIAFLSHGACDAVATARRAAQGKNVLVIGANAARQCLEQALVDEIVIDLVPLLLGDGVRLFGQPGGHPIQLQPQDFSQAGPVANLHFGVPLAA